MLQQRLYVYIYKGHFTSISRLPLSPSKGFTVPPIRNQEKARKTKQNTFSLNYSFLSAMYFLLQYVHVLFSILLQVLSSESTLHNFETKLPHDFSSDFLTKTS